MILKQYQKKAVKELLGATVKIINQSPPNSCDSFSKSIVFKAPTGSGKTIIMQDFLKNLSESELKDEYAFL